MNLDKGRQARTKEGVFHVLVLGNISVMVPRNTQFSEHWTSVLLSISEREMQKGSPAALRKSDHHSPYEFPHAVDIFKIYIYPYATVGMNLPPIASIPAIPDRLSLRLGG